MCFICIVIISQIAFSKGPNHEHLTLNYCNHAIPKAGVKGCWNCMSSDLFLVNAGLTCSYITY